LLPALPFSGKPKAKKLKFLLRLSLKMAFTLCRHRVQPFLSRCFEILILDKI
jgi:hypothetical protein